MVHAKPQRRQERQEENPLREIILLSAGIRCIRGQGRGTRKTKGEGRALTNGTGDGDTAAILGHKRMHNGKAQAGAAADAVLPRPPLARLIDAVKALENIGQVSLGNAAAAVRNL